MNFLHALYALVPVLAVFAAICLAAWAACRERHVPGPLLLCGPLPAPDASDAEFEAWALRALAGRRPDPDESVTAVTGWDDPFATTRRQIAALPERKSA